MVTVQFYLYDPVNSTPIPGVAVKLDGVTNTTDSNGIAEYTGVAQGSHSYTLTNPGYTLTEGLDPFSRPLNLSGTFTIEWLPNPEYPWPEDQTWINLFRMQPGVMPPTPDIPAILPAAALVVLFLALLRRG